ncbi:MAG: DUF4372 domain-containing protein [Flavisolibacter sp.]
MHQGKSVYSHIKGLISHKVVNSWVGQYKGDYKTKHFTCHSQLLYMAFGQVTHQESLSDTII